MLGRRVPGRRPVGPNRPGRRSRSGRHGRRRGRPGGAFHQRDPPGGHVRREQPPRPGRRQPPLRVAFQQAPDDRGQRPRLRGRPDLVVHDGVQHPAERVPVEGRLAGQRGAQQRPERPQVAGGSGGGALHALGRGVFGRADERAGLADGGGSDEAGDAEVGEHHALAARLHQYVGGFDVAVQDPAVVGRGQRAEQGEPGTGGVADAQRALGGEPVGERAALHELHDDEGAPLVLHDVVHDDDVRMLDLGDGTRLPQRLGGLRTAVDVELLDGDRAPEEFVGGAPDGAHAAPAQPLPQTVTPGDRFAVARLVLRHVRSPSARSRAMMPHTSGAVSVAHESVRPGPGGFPAAPGPGKHR
ncbi:hypothetical protein EES37_27870 [Streptomyces sp. ADI91-18]|nr:hypothetical protein EES37_27870 [Streptomyces sp. ADI91-18]